MRPESEKMGGNEANIRHLDPLCNRLAMTHGLCCTRCQGDSDEQVHQHLYQLNKLNFSASLSIPGRGRGDESESVWSLNQQCMGLTEKCSFVPVFTSADHK